jgi:hypothetical protein
MSRASGRVRAAAQSASLRATLLAVLATGLLATVPCVAQATYITDFKTWAPSAGPSVPTMGWRFGVEVTYNDRLSPWDTGKVWEETASGRVMLTETCWYSGCSELAQVDASRDYAHPPTRTFKVALYHTNTGASYAERTLVVHERRLHFALAADFDWSPGLFHVTVPGSLANTSLDTIIYANGREAARCNVYWSHCETPVTSGASYYAAVEDPDGNLYGITPSYRATSSTTGVKETADQIDLPRLGALFATTTDVCDTLLSFQGTHFENSSVSDQEIACQAALANGSSMTALLQSVAAAGGGTTAVLWWLEHQQTIQVLSPDWPTTPWPDAEVPPIADLPQVWQGAVINLADAYKLSAQGKNITQAAAEAIAAACLWNLSRISDGLEACRTLPVFVTGSDVAEATNHDLEAIVGHPQWAMLNYEASGAKSGSRSWYQSVPPCNVSGDAGQQCDEFPYWATEQGGPLAPITPSLKYIDGIDNTTQGGKYGNFVTACALRTGTPQTGANAVGGTAFLVVPVPAVPSTYLCNRG